MEKYKSKCKKHVNMAARDDQYFGTGFQVAPKFCVCVCIFYLFYVHDILFLKNNIKLTYHIESKSIVQG